MKRLKIFVAVLALGLNLGVSFAADAPLDEHLEIFRPYLGTWKGHFKDSTPEKPVIDVATWERALNGKAIRVLHSINDGGYGGESLIFWDAEKKQLVYYYFTTAGFYTTGTTSMVDGKLTNHEKVTGGASGTTEVKSTSQLRPDGSFIAEAQYLKKGKWEPGHSVTYKRAPDAKVVFK